MHGRVSRQAVRAAAVGAQRPVAIVVSTKGGKVGVVTRTFADPTRALNEDMWSLMSTLDFILAPVPVPVPVATATDMPCPAQRCSITDRRVRHVVECALF